MAIKRLATLALFAMGALAQEAASAGVNEPIVADANEPNAGQSPPNPLLSQLKVAAEVTFPDSEVFGIKLVNGRPTTAHFAIHNGEEQPVTISMIGGSLWPLDVTELTAAGPVRNLSTTTYNTEIAPAGNLSLTYKFATELHPQDLRLLLAGIVKDQNGVQFQLEAFNGTVSVVEAPLSLFDPQTLFIYAFLIALFGGTCYFIYNTWIVQFFPQQKKASRRTAPASAPSQATTTGASGYDESWIDPRHLQRPEAKRVRSGQPKTRAK
ncbi:hypothetical protein BT63DRAFT_427460 [Microthyrium microscopicum]|uniref:Uncharacterized protein n=1 Tax=Microthyrium microscopicum TaxID=703497 RepID=A0A6A6U632_9PEZI|nr:hypothetical protein BT63DRAFT_427460 [Microthyrium microscopicum]